MLLGELFQELLAGLHELDDNLALVEVARAAADHPPLFHAVDQFDSGVVADLKPVGEIPNRRSVGVAGKASYGKQKLMLLRFEARFARGLFAEMQEQANLISKLGERLIVLLVHS